MDLNRVIIDTDCGVDDAFAITMAIQKGLDVVLLSTVSGNCSLEDATNNTCAIAELNNYQNFIAKGSPYPLHYPARHVYHMHGDYGLGGIKLNSSYEKNDLFDSYLSLIDDKTQIICLAPLTNISRVFYTQPCLVLDKPQLVILGGSLNTGNVTSNAEYNFFADPHAANSVFHLGLDTVVIPLDIVNQVSLTEDIFVSNNPVIMQLHDIYKGSNFNLKDLKIPDLLAIYVASHPEIFEVKAVDLHVCETEDNRGQVSIRDNENSSIKIVTSLDLDAYYKLLLKDLKEIEND